MLEDVFSCVLIGIIILYCFQFAKYGIVLTYAKGKEEHVLKKDFLQLTVLIPVRNEMNSLSSLLSDLKKQSYPLRYYEILFIDDHSTDGTLDYLQNVVKKYSNINCFSLGENESGKKDAITFGVEMANGEWIIQTDADCTLPEDFVLLHASRATKEDLVLLAGPVMFRPRNGLWNRLESLEFLSLAGAGMASFLNRKPVMCNGANLSYSKSFYLEVKEKLSQIQSPSGDDIFLMEEAKRLHKGVEYLYSSRAIVLTEPAGSFGAFISQRVRWGSKAPFYKDLSMIYLAVLVWVSNAGLLASLIVSFFQPDFFSLFLLLLGLKSIFDFWVLFQTTKFFSRMSLLAFFPVATIIYYFYITFVGLVSLVGGFSWKGRRY